MSIAELFESGAKKALNGHFKNVVAIARADGTISSEEKDLMNKIARNIGLTEEEVAEIIEHPDKYPINPPVSREDRHERLFSLIQMMMVDGEIDSNEIDTISRISLCLGFNENEAARVTNIIINGLAMENDKESILEKTLS